MIRWTNKCVNHSQRYNWIAIAAVKELEMEIEIEMEMEGCVWEVE